MYLESNTKRIFVIACLEKKFVFQSEISTDSLILFSKIEKFYRVKVSKWNQTRHGVSPVYVESTTKRILAIASLGKKFFIRKVAIISNILRLLNFKNRSFVRSRSWSNRTKLGMEYPQGR